MDQRIISAIENRNTLEFLYEGLRRIVEPHCYGLTHADNEGLRAYQVRGQSSSGKIGWKMYNVNQIERLTVLSEKFSGTRKFYRKGDKDMQEIFIEL